MASRQNNIRLRESCSPSSTLSDDESDGYSTPPNDNITLPSSRPYQPELPSRTVVSSFSNGASCLTSGVQQLRDLSISDGAEMQAMCETTAQLETQMPVCTTTETELQRKISRQSTEINKLRTQLNNALTENEQLKQVSKKYKEVEEANERLRSKISAENAKERMCLDKTMEEKAKIESKYKDTIQKLEQIKQENECLANKLKAKDHLEDDVRQLSVDLTVKNKELEEKYSELAGMQQKCEKLKTACDELEKEKKVIASELKEKYIELKIAEEYHQEVDTKVHVLQDQKEETEKTLQETENERNELSVKVMDLEPAVEKLETDKANLTQKLEFIKQENAILTRELKKATALTDDIINVMKIEKQAAGKAQTQLEMVETQRDDFQRQRDNLRRNLAIRNDELAKLMKQNENLIEERRRLRVDLNEANRELLFCSQGHDSYSSQDPQQQYVHPQQQYVHPQQQYVHPQLPYPGENCHQDR